MHERPPQNATAGGQPLEEDATPIRRDEERLREDSRYVPVIIKRTDAVIRHPDDVLSFAIEEGLEQIRRPALSLWLSSLAGGLFVGFTAMAVGVILALEQSHGLPLPARVAVAMVYPFGFVVCLMSGVELFTEHTATAVYPVLDRRTGASGMLRLWAIVLTGNLLGACGSAALLVAADSVVGAREGYIELGRHFVVVSTGPLLLSSVLAGWLMGLAGWLMLATTPATAQILCVYIVTFLIGLGGLHHSIAGSVEMFAALFSSDSISWAQGLRFIALAVLGNLVGGSVFVAVLNYGHIRETQAD